MNAYTLSYTADENPNVRAELRHFNAKIVRLHAKRMQANIMDTDTVDNIPGETPTLYQIIRKHKRHSSRIVLSVRDNTGTIQTSTTGIATTFTSYFRQKYHCIDSDEKCAAALAKLIRAKLPPGMEHTYENPFTPEEIQQAISSGGTNRALGRDGLSFEFYKPPWALIGDDLCGIINNMFHDRTITTHQKLGNQNLAQC
jgi:hypothetical protein